jgi:hypothetical protein
MPEKYHAVTAVFQGHKYHLPEWWPSRKDFVLKVLDAVGYPNPHVAASSTPFTVTSTVCLNINNPVACSSVWNFNKGEVVVTGEVYWERFLPFS